MPFYMEGHRFCVWMCFFLSPDSLIHLHLFIPKKVPSLLGFVVDVRINQPITQKRFAKMQEPGKGPRPHPFLPLPSNADLPSSPSTSETSFLGPQISSL